MQEERREERKTEQGDELGEEHTIAPEEESENAYRPPRQPSQRQPDEDTDEEDARRGAQD